ncbi:olfactory receptor 2A14-like [Lethenteron reissneri]|uniref:olfactory receptor 2A14-like n=1 Tax=Lethenteron reissneri TaxID=7753 RepID=UPI002AB68278|nr:olfactory receptor 2A14-like [Lethenteron reissneri]
MVKPAASRHVTVALFVTSYALTLLCNSLLCLAILLERTLHKPMFLFMAFLCATDVLEVTSKDPRIVLDLVTNPSYFPMPSCIAQMFFTHVFASIQCFHMAVMSVDRYLAICHPLRYATLMPNGRAAALCLIESALATASSLGMVLLVSSLEFCGPLVMANSPYCDFLVVSNWACGGTALPNVAYGFLTAAITLVLPVCVIAVTYGLIVAECRKGDGRGRSRRKAAYTCATHFIIFTVFFVFILCTFGSSMAAGSSMPRELLFFVRTLHFVVPPVMNPIVYGLRTAEVRVCLLRWFRRNRVRSR